MSYPGGRGGLQDDPGFTMPPPNNAGTGGVGHVTWAASSGTPKKKSLTYDKLVVEYDYEHQLLTVSETTDTPTKSMQFNQTELAELRNALNILGLNPPGSGVQHR